MESMHQQMQADMDQKLQEEREQMDQKLQEEREQMAANLKRNMEQDLQKKLEEERERMKGEVEKMFQEQVAAFMTRMQQEKELGRPIIQESFKATHIKKKKPTDEDSRVEPRAQETHEKYLQKFEELHSQGITPTQEKEDQCWQDCAGVPVRGSVSPKKPIMKRGLGCTADPLLAMII